MSARKPKSIISLDEFDEPKNILIYGNSGVGKTGVAATAPNSLILRTEPGTISAKRLGRKADVWPCEEWDEFVKAFRWVKENPDHGYDWLVIDNAADMQNIMMAGILATAKKQNSNRDEDIPAIQDYQKWYLQFKRFVKAINALPVNTLWTAHAMRKTDHEGEDIVLPNIQGQDYSIAQFFCGSMQAVGYMDVRNKGKGDDRVTVRRILWEASPVYFAKDRYMFRKDEYDKYTIVAEGSKQMTDMAEISRRIDAALEEGGDSSPKKPAPSKVTPIKRAATRRIASK